MIQYVASPTGHCIHDWRQYSNSDRYYCTKCLAQIVLEDNLKPRCVVVRQKLEGL